MVYGQMLSINEIRLIESTDLSYKEVSLDVLHDLVCDGLEVANLYITELGFLATPDIAQKSIGFRYQHKIYFKGNEIGDLLDDEGYLGIRCKTPSMVDLSIICDDIIITSKDNFYHIWYKNSGYEMVKRYVSAIYRSNGKIMVSIMGTSTLHGELNLVLKPSWYFCSRSEYMRYMLFK